MLRWDKHPFANASSLMEGPFFLKWISNVQTAQLHLKSLHCIQLNPSTFNKMTRIKFCMPGYRHSRRSGEPLHSPLSVLLVHLRWNPTLSYRCAARTIRAWRIKEQGHETIHVSINHSSRSTSISCIAAIAHEVGFQSAQFCQREALLGFESNPSVDVPVFEAQSRS